MRFEPFARLRGATALGAVLATLTATSAGAVNVNFVSGSTGNDLAIFKELLKPWEAETGNTVTIVPMPSSTTDQFAQYRLWLAAGNQDIDVYMVDVIWAERRGGRYRRGTFPLDHRIPDCRRQVGRATALHRRAGALLSQGSA